MNKNIKVFVSYKEKHPVFESGIFTPIQTGRAIADEIFGGMLGDDTGDNVSKDNPKYNELSAQYWVWKNYEKVGNPEYVGFVHYRRHFIFDAPNDLDSHQPWMPKSHVYRFDYIDEKYKRMMTDDDICYTCGKYDCIVLKPYNVKELGVKSIRDQFGSLPGQKSENFDIFINTILRESPEYSDAIDELLATNIQYLCNMYIMKKDLFFEYCEFAFNILKKVDEQIDSSHYSEKELRYLGFMGEILLGIFVSHHEKNKLRIKKLDGTVVMNTDDATEIQPAFSGIDVALTTYVTEKNAPYLGACLASLVAHSNANKQYDIVILETDLNEHTKSALSAICKGKSNISLRFYDTRQTFIKFDIPLRRFRMKCYKLSAPSIFDKYAKLIYFEWNYIFQKDILELMTIDLQGNIVAACKDFNANGFYGSAKMNWREYAAGVLAMGNMYDYVDTGLLLIDVKKFNEEDIINQCFELAQSHELKNIEQDSINSVLQGRVSFIPNDWAICTLWQIGDYDSLYSMEFDYQCTYKKFLKAPSAVHYISPTKPWLNPSAPLSALWWKYSRETPFYEEVLQRLIANLVANGGVSSKDGVLQLRKELTGIHIPNINNRFSSNEYKMKLQYVLSHMLYFRFSKLRYAIRKAFSFGAKNCRYKLKYEATKRLLNDARKFKKQMKAL